MSIFRVLGNLQRTLSDLMSNLRLNIWKACAAVMICMSVNVIFSRISSCIMVFWGFHLKKYYSQLVRDDYCTLFPYFQQYSGFFEITHDLRHY